MAYFLKYTLSFDDIHNTHPAKWVVNILDDQGSGSDVPVVLVPSAKPLVIQRINNTDDKSTSIIGRQAVISYEFTGAIGEPPAELFFDVDERRFRVEVLKNGILDGVFYVKPDACTFSLKYQPITVTLTAVDGLSFAKSVPWNAFDDTGLLAYQTMSLYDIIMTRGLLQILDSDTELNSICTLKPDNIGGALTFMNDLYIHSDMFYDFTTGPLKVADVIQKICQIFYARLFISQNKVWFIRIQDLYSNSITAENYIHGIYNSLPLPTIFKTCGPDASANDAQLVDNNSTITLFAAIKEVKFSLNYQGINRLSNFQWAVFDGTNFSQWRKQTPLTVSRGGSGTINDPYFAFINYIGEISPDAVVTLSQGSTGTNSILSNIGDIFQASFKYEFANTNSFYVAIYGIDTVTGDQICLDGSNKWTWINGSYPTTFQIGRSGLKREGNFSIVSDPLPKIIDGHVLSGNPFQIFFALYAPVGINTLDGSIAPGVAIYSVKLAIYPISSAGRKIIDVNNARFSLQKDSQQYFFIDTGVNSISNTIFVAGNVPSKNWSSASNPTDIQTIERQMSDAYIDQYAKSIPGIEGSLNSNSIEFWNVFNYDAYPWRKFIRMSDNYDVRRCDHSGLSQELLPENGASTTYNEYDLETVIN